MVYLADPSIYAQSLSLTSSSADRYPVPVTLFLVGILVLITLLILDSGGDLTDYMSDSLRPSSLIAFSFSISGLTSGLIAIFSKSASQRSGVMSG
jgi:hypothetical protein